ncbi:MAG: hypothetical protein QOD83_1505 [Solirubrobacteraceae bacterium]|jgi:hypothetical protein|nr:hypothetical protein [Solirubrobacteraceae bacterium]
MLTLLQKYPISAKKGIDSVQALQNHLAVAVAVELSTVPLYLYAAYSIQTSNRTQWAPEMSAFRTIRSVVIEEMLHLCLARNLLTAIGGQMACYDSKVVPTYPSNMLYHKRPLQFRLEPLSSGLIRNVFMPLELPAKAHAKPQSDHYRTLGQFYAAIRDAFVKLDEDEHDELWYGPTLDIPADDKRAIREERKALQYSRAYWNDDGGGTPILVQDLTSALAAIATIVEQGEGEGVHRDEVPIRPDKPKLGLVERSHYAKFRMIAAELDDKNPDDVDNDDKRTWPVPCNPKPEVFDFPGQAGETEDQRSDVGRLAQLFDAAYCYVLCLLDRIYETPTHVPKSNTTSERYGLERKFVAAMGGLLYPIADQLVRYPLKDGTHAAPGFRYYAFPAGNMKAHLIDLCDDVTGAFPSLGGDDGVRQLLNHMPDLAL